MPSRIVARVAQVVSMVAALVGVLLVAVVTAAVLLDPNDYKGRLVGAVQDATGRTLTLGELRLTRSLWPTLEASDVSLSNLPGGSRPFMAHAERVEGQLSLLALFRHEIDITRLTLIGPNILFEQVDGQPNWVFTSVPVATSPAPVPALTPAAQAGAPFDLRIRAAHVRDGMVTWKLPARTKVVGIQALDYRRLRADGPIEAKSTLVYSDNQPFALDIAAQPTGGVRDPWRTQLHFAAFQADATAQGTMDVTGQYDLQVDAAAASLDRLNALLPEMRLPALKQAKLSARIGNGAQPGDLPVLAATTLEFASADLRDRVPGLVLGATKAALPAAGGQATVESGGQYLGTGFRLTGRFGVPVHPDGKASLPVELKADAAAAGSLGLKGKLALDGLRFAGLDAAATLRTEALAGLRPVLGASLPALTGVEFDGQVSVPPGSGPVRLAGVTLATEQGDIAGDGRVDLTGPPALTGTWRSGTLDLDAVLAAFGIDLSGPAAAPTGPMIPDTRLPWAALRGPALDMTAAIGTMRFQGQTWRDVQLPLSLKGGVLQAAPVSVAMPGGGPRLQVALTADARAGAASLGISAPALPLALLARYAGLPGPVVGNAVVSTQLRARGQTVRELAATLDGPFSITAVNGQFSNQALIGMTSAALEALGIAVPAQGQTALTCFGLAGSFAAGVGTVKTLALETTYLSLEGAGQVDLGRETVAFKLQPMAQVAGSPVSVPVVVQGPFRAVSGSLAAGGLDKLGFLIDGLFGGDRSTACATAGLTR